MSKTTTTTQTEPLIFDVSLQNDNFQFCQEAKRVVKIDYC